MKQVIYALSGSAVAPPLLDRLLKRFIDRVKDDLEDALWKGTFDEKFAAREIYEVYGSLSERQQLELMLAPQFFCALSDAKRSGAIEEIQHFVDFVSTQADSSNVVPVSADIPSVDLASDLFLLGGTIIVDLGSVYCQRVDPTSPVFMGEFEPLVAFEKKLILEKLRVAFDEVEKASPTIARLIRNYTRRIYVRKVGDHVPASEQVDTEIGAIRLRNIHSDLYTHDQVVDDLIHESTHNFLGTFENIYFPFHPFGQRAASYLRPVSPWSLRPIQSLPFVHACFVYYAMFSYCNVRLREVSVDAQERKRLISRANRYASGFLMPGRLSSYVTSLSRVDPRAVQAIDWMEEVVQSKFRA